MGGRRNNASDCVAQTQVGKKMAMHGLLDHTHTIRFTGQQFNRQYSRTKTAIVALSKRNQQCSITGIAARPARQYAASTNAAAGERSTRFRMAPIAATDERNSCPFTCNAPQCIVCIGE
jgi:hypothetical protein